MKLATGGLSNRVTFCCSDILEIISLLLFAILGPSWPNPTSVQECQETVKKEEDKTP